MMKTRTHVRALYHSISLRTGNTGLIKSNKTQTRVLGLDFSYERTMPTLANIALHKIGVFSQMPSTKA